MTLKWPWSCWRWWQLLLFILIAKRKPAAKNFFWMQQNTSRNSVGNWAVGIEKYRTWGRKAESEPPQSRLSNVYSFKAGVFCKVSRKRRANLTSESRLPYMWFTLAHLVCTLSWTSGTCAWKCCSHWNKRPDHHFLPLTVVNISVSGTLGGHITGMDKVMVPTGTGPVQQPQGQGFVTISVASLLTLTAHGCCDWFYFEHSDCREGPPLVS